MSLRSTKKRLEKLEARLRKREAAALPEQETFVDEEGCTCHRVYWRDDTGAVRSLVLRVVSGSNVDVSKL